MQLSVGLNEHNFEARFKHTSTLGQDILCGEDWKDVTVISVIQNVAYASLCGIMPMWLILGDFRVRHDVELDFVVYNETS